LSLLPSSLVQLIVTLEPVFTAAIAYFLLGERLNAAQVAGSLVIMGSVLFLRVYEGRRSRREAIRADIADEFDIDEYQRTS
ncbi:MAG: EamA family transporter, partial [Chloroflexi bacterium]